MSPKILLIIFVSLRLLQYVVERILAAKNRKYYLQPQNLKEAQDFLKISDDDLKKTLAYTNDKYKFSSVVNYIKTTVFLILLIVGFFGWLELQSMSITNSENNIVVGLGFFGLLLVFGMVFNLPFDYYSTFKLEEKHGFNKQTLQTFLIDRVKGLAIATILGGLILTTVLWIMESMGSNWWVYAWIAMSLFSLLTAWIYPTLLAPLFNKFSPLPEGELKKEIDTLAAKIGFNHSGLSIMNASKRTAHGNAYFTGVFGKKKIVLFDTLVNDLNTKEVVAVLAHELGHFKLNHVRNGLIRGIITTGVIFFLISLFLPMSDFYYAFKLSEASSYGALFVFSLWFGIVEFLLQPFETYLSRKNEFAADTFAKIHLNNHSDLASALLKLREKSHAMPICHPLYSTFYYSHPPMLERLKALTSSN